MNAHEKRRPKHNECGTATRADIRYDTNAERLCRILLGIVEDMGASESLTRAVLAIDQARNHIADHVELPEEPDNLQRCIDYQGPHGPHAVIYPGGEWQCPGVSE